VLAYLSRSDACLHTTNACLHTNKTSFFAEFRPFSRETENLVRFLQLPVSFGGGRICVKSTRFHVIFPVKSLHQHAAKHYKHYLLPHIAQQHKHSFSTHDDMAKGYTLLSPAQDGNARYRVLHTLFAVFHALSFIAGVCVKLTLGISASARVYFIRQERDAPSPIVESTGSIDPSWFLCCASLVSAICHWIIATSPAPIPTAPDIRYCDYSISSTFMIFTVALLSGVCDVFQLVYMCIAQVVLCLLGAVIGSRAIDKIATVSLATLLHMTTWGALFAILAKNLTKDTYWVFAIMGSLFVLFSLFALVRYLEVAHKINLHQADQGFLILSAVAKTFLQWSLLGGIQSMDDSSDSPLRVYYIVMGTTIALSLVLTWGVLAISHKYPVPSSS
jgi:hypothetical protein